LIQSSPSRHAVPAQSPFPSPPPVASPFRRPLRYRLGISSAIALVACAAFAIPAAILAEDPASPAVLRAGAARADITPDVGLPLWGYGGRKDLPARGTRDGLEAAVVVLDFGPQPPPPGSTATPPLATTGGDRAASAGARAVDRAAASARGRIALVGVDLGRAPARRTMESLRARLRAEAGIGHVFVVGSHTHHGPCLELETSEPTATWIRTLVDRLTAASVAATGAMVPAKLAVGSVEIARNRNRHSRIEPKAVDRRLTVLRVDGVDERPIATVVNFAAHPTSLPWNVFEYSADFPGPLKDRVEALVGGVCVFLQGASGDLSTDRKGLSMEEYGATLGDDVVRLWRELVPVVPATPRLAVREEELRFERLRVDLSEPLTRIKYTLAFFKSLVDHYVEEYRDGVRPRLQVALIGDDVGIVGVSGEFFANHAIRLRERARLRETLFLGYCSGYHQYFPTIEAVAEGGYGADPDVSPVEIGAGERIMDRALWILWELRGKLDR